MASARSNPPSPARRWFLRQLLLELLLVGGGLGVVERPPVWGRPNRLEAQAVFAGLLRRYGRLTTLTADFTQIHHGRQTLREQGTLALKRNGRMRWDYAAPQVKQFVCDGRQTYFYSAARRQYTVEPVRAGRDPRTPFLFLLGDRRLARLFRQVELAAEPPVRAGYVVLRLTPRERLVLITAVLAECHPTTFELARISLLGATGERDDFIFSNIVENRALPETFFEFTPPAEAQRIGD